MALQGLVFLGEDEFDTYEEDQNDRQWIAQAVDDLVLMATQDMGPASAEREWLVELHRLRHGLLRTDLSKGSSGRRNLREMRTVRGPVQRRGTVQIRTSQKTAATQNCRRSNKGGKDYRTPSRTRTSAVWSSDQAPRGRKVIVEGEIRTVKGLEQRERSRPGGRRGERDQQRHDARTNAHRPWRRDSGRSSTAGPSSAPASACLSRVSLRPAIRIATVHGQGACHHSWHVLLDMANAMEAPETQEYGVSSHQRANIIATLHTMSIAERLQTMGSLLRTFAVLFHDLADCVEEAQDTEEGDGTRWLNGRMRSR